MAKPARLTRTVSYRRCLIQPKSSQTLQQLMSSALQNLAVAEDRTEPLDAQSTAVRVVGRSTEVNKVLCGYLSTWERGRSQAVITDNPKAASLSVGAVAPTQAKSGLRNEFIPGVLYFAVLNNHVAFVQNASIRGASLESHIAWLLKSKASLLPTTCSIVLSDEAKLATKQRIRESHVKSIGFGQTLMGQVAVPLSSKSSALAQDAPKESRRFKPQGPVAQFFRDLLSPSEYERLGLNKIYDGDLDIWIEVRFPKRERSHAENTIKLMDNLAIGLRDIEGDQVSLLLENGHRVSGSDLKVAGSVSVQANVNGSPDEDDMWIELSAWLYDQIKNGVVDPD